MTGFKGKRVTHIDAGFKWKSYTKMATPPSFEESVTLHQQVPAWKRYAFLSFWVMNQTDRTLIFRENQRLTGLLSLFEVALRLN
jgi:hypothetical protein